MISGTRYDRHFNFHLGGHQIATGTDFKYLGIILAKTGTSTKPGNIMSNKLKRKSM